jgi:hypothetical protein
MQPVPCLLDQHIREALKITLREQDSTGTIIDELPLLRGRGRADLAFVNGNLCGYEIKSEADSLVRLGMQTQNYETTFEFNTIVAAKKHLDLAFHRLPKTWGIIEAKQLKGRTVLRLHRKASRNLNLTTSALARLLWKGECLRLVRKNGVKVSSNISVIELWNLMELMNLSDLCREVRAALKRRPLKVAAPQIPDGDSRTTVATA